MLRSHEGGCAAEEICFCQLSVFLLRNHSGRAKNSESFLVSTPCNVDVAARKLRLQFVLCRVIVVAMTSWRRECGSSSRKAVQRVAWAGHEVVVTVSSSACTCVIEAAVFVLARMKLQTVGVQPA